MTIQLKLSRIRHQIQFQGNAASGVILQPGYTDLNLTFSESNGLASTVRAVEWARRLRWMLLNGLKLAAAERFMTSLKPVLILLCVLPVTVYVNKDHPMTTITKEEVKAFIEQIESDLANGWEAQIFELKLARIALASLEAEPIGAFHIADQLVGGTSDYIKDGEWPIDNEVIEVYAAPPATVVPENTVFG